ncbi:unnamed protein product [Schistosoma mattheei]|uniref:Uncharacterized protein n=1 Tax=Schistosoma mattheei TaxID=31246 RepID=A0A3P8H4E7_9TREM|nr:unnamed protein product [Schistosoma mattheei]
MLQTQNEDLTSKASRLALKRIINPESNTSSTETCQHEQSSTSRSHEHQKVDPNITCQTTDSNTCGGQQSQRSPSHLISSDQINPTNSPNYSGTHSRRTSEGRSSTCGLDSTDWLNSLSPDQLVKRLRCTDNLAEQVEILGRLHQLCGLDWNTGIDPTQPATVRSLLKEVVYGAYLNSCVTMSNVDLKPKYEPGEKLLCFHGPLMYEAKCLDVKVKEDGVMYFVHYQGWNKKRSGKVKVLRKSDLKSQSLPPPEVLKDVERTLKPGHLKQGCTFWVTSLTVLIEEESPKAKQSKSNSEADQKPSTPVTTEVKESEDVKAPSKPPEESSGVFNITTVSSRRRKSRATSGIKSIENDDSLLSKPQLMVSIPPSLKAWLVDDWDLITRQARLYELPASQPISTLLSDFLESAEIEVKSEPTSEPQNSQHNINPAIRPDLRREFLAGIQHYFNLIIGSHLLYKFERLQYAELLKRHTDKRMLSSKYIHYIKIVYCNLLPANRYDGQLITILVCICFTVVPVCISIAVKLRDMVSCTKVDVNSLPVLEALVNEFLQFLRQNEGRYFRLEDYTVATAEYQRRAMC